MKDSENNTLILIKKTLINLSLLKENEDIPQVYKTCFTHSSIRRRYNNEKLEFLGDSVLNFIITNILINKYPSLTESDLSKKRSHLVSRDVCYQVARKINLDKCLLISFGERKNSGNLHKNNLSCTMEALIGAIYTYSGTEKATDFIKEHWIDLFEIENKDYKTDLQEFCHKKFKQFPVYEVIKISGTEHQPLFEVKASLPDNSMSEIGIGKSKKLAEKNAACIILHKIFN